MVQLTAKQVSILLWLHSKDEKINYIMHREDMIVLYNERLITTHLSGTGHILSQSGQKMVDKVLSLFNPTVMELSKSQYSNVSSE